MNKKVAIYCRVSTQEQSLEVQVNECSNYCIRNNLEFKVFKEKISGAKSSRPVLDNMLQELRTGAFNIVMVHKLDRLGRSTIHLINLIEEFKNKGVAFISVTQGINTTDAMGRFFLTVLAGIAELEREFIKERTTKRLAALKASGKRLGRPPGSKDKKNRRKSGYYMRYAKK